MNVKIIKVVDVKTHRLGKALIQKRGMRGLRPAALESGIHHATLQRLEQGDTPTMETFRRAMIWLGVDPAEWSEYMKFDLR